MTANLMDLSFSEFLVVLRNRGQGERAADLEKRVLAGLVPPLTSAQVMKSTVGMVTMSLEFMSEVSLMESLQPHTVKARMEELTVQGFEMIPGEKHAK